MGKCRKTLRNKCGIATNHDRRPGHRLLAAAPGARRPERTPVMKNIQRRDSPGWLLALVVVVSITLFSFTGHGLAHGHPPETRAPGSPCPRGHGGAKKSRRRPRGPRVADRAVQAEAEQGPTVLAFL
ncbi:unnamed protein product [Prorocentrum cordatum]|uniref:Uncharacterized protein n=1 Tax=Prorocentrum cordatum TaxID=2364126 RepID=A0ABN9T822_9DINO|nr:unnamed protein product [Polarella glacialis]